MSEIEIRVRFFFAFGLCVFTRSIVIVGLFVFSSEQSLLCVIVVTGWQCSVAAITTTATTATIH